MIEPQKGVRDNLIIVEKPLHNVEYIAVPESPNFSGLPLPTVIPQFLQQSAVDGRTASIKAWRRWIQARLAQ